MREAIEGDGGRKVGRKIDESIKILRRPSNSSSQLEGSAENDGSTKQDVRGA